MNDWAKILIMPVAGLLILIAVFAGYIKPQNTKIEQMNEQLDILLGKGDRMVPIEKILAQEAVVDSLHLIVKDLKDRLYPVAEFADLGRAIESSGRKFDLRLVNLTPDYSKLNLIQQAGVEITELPITINMTGHFMEFAHYLERLSEFPYVKATEVTLKRSDEEGSTNQIIIEIHGLVIFKNKLTQKESQVPKPVSAQT
jgi:Tfp pilus assembly protein PilO